MTLVGALRISLIAEGAGELSRSVHAPPGELLPDDALGAGHVLIRRIAAEATSLPNGAIQFVASLRRSTGQPLLGSALAEPALLKEVLVWPQARRGPSVSVVLVDADGDSKRFKDIETMVKTLRTPTAVAVAVQEFEAWLIADDHCLSQVMGTSVKSDKRPDDLHPGVAKKRLTALCEKHRPNDAGSSVRVELASLMSLKKAAGRSSSLKRATKKLSELFKAAHGG